MEKEKDYYILSEEEYNNHNFKKALFYININLKLHPNDHLSYLLKGNIESYLNKYEKSII